MNEYVFDSTRFSFVVGWDLESNRYILVISEKDSEKIVWSSLEKDVDCSLEALKQVCREHGGDLPLEVAWLMIRDKYGGPSDKCPENGEWGNE